MSEPRPNILFITADQWRGDCTGYAGHPVVQTPNLDALAAGGTAFLRHYAAAAPCSPARAAMYTGLYQMNNRVVGNGAPLDHRFDNIARAARRAGYTPTLFGYTDIAADPRVHDPADPVLRTYEGVLPGFEVEQALLGDERPWTTWLAKQGYGPEVTNDPYRRAAPGGRLPLAPAPFEAQHSQTAYLVDRTIEWIGQQPEDTPWFAHVSLIHPHPPFVVSEPFHSLYAHAASPAFAAATDEVMAHPAIEILRGQRVSGFVPGAQTMLTELSPQELDQIRRVYFGLITEVDMHLGRLFSALEQVGQSDSTLIVMTSDHGEMMGDYGLLGKGGFFPQSQHIPLILQGPGVAAGQRIDEFTSAVDIFPTLLDQLGVAARNGIDGHSLTPVLRGQTAETGRNAVLWEFDFREQIANGAGATGPYGPAGDHLLALMDEAGVYVSTPGRPSLLLSQDSPGAMTRNLTEPAEAPQVRLRAAEKLLSLRQAANDQTLANIRLGPDGAVTI
ncbi:MAG: sulfatase-like hydrolase/transferase [Pseudomonadota bacterium]